MKQLTEEELDALLEWAETDSRPLAQAYGAACEIVGCGIDGDYGLPPIQYESLVKKALELRNYIGWLAITIGRVKPQTTA